MKMLFSCLKSDIFCTQNETAQPVLVHFLLNCTNKNEDISKFITSANSEYNYNLSQAFLFTPSFDHWCILPIFSSFHAMTLYPQPAGTLQTFSVLVLSQSFIPASAEPLLRFSFDRIGRLKCKDGLNLQKSKVGWFALVGSTLHFYLEGSEIEEIHLRRVNELCEWDVERQILDKFLATCMHINICFIFYFIAIQQDSEVLVLVERGRWEN